MVSEPGAERKTRDAIIERQCGQLAWSCTPSCLLAELRRAMALAMADEQSAAKVEAHGFKFMVVLLWPKMVSIEVGIHSSGWDCVFGEAVVENI